MSTISHHTMSLDGFIAGPDDSMDWVFGYGEATSLADETMNRMGAILAGRRWFDLAVDRWEGADGIYGGAFGGRVFVLSHRPPEDSGDPRISFVSSGIEQALATAQDAAGTRTWASSARASPGNASRPVGWMRSWSTWRPCCSAAESGSTEVRAIGKSSWSARGWARRSA